MRFDYVTGKDVDSDKKKLQRGKRMAEYRLLKTEGRAKRAEFHTVHGTIQTPVFMNVGTIGAIKGAVSTMDLHEIGTQVKLQYLPSSCTPGRPGGKAAWRTAQVYGMG